MSSSGSSSVSAGTAEGILKYNGCCGDVVHVVFMIDNSASMKTPDAQEADCTRRPRYLAVQRCIGTMLQDQKKLSSTIREEANKEFFASFVVFDDNIKLRAGPLSLADAIEYCHTTLSKVTPKWGGKVWYCLGWNGCCDGFAE